MYAVLAIYVGLIVLGLLRRNKDTPDSSTSHLLTTRSFDTLLSRSLALYFAFLALNMVVARPETHVSTGVHQTVGPCDVRALDLARQERQVYLCAGTHAQDWDFSCTESGAAPADYAEWYTVCGRAHGDKALWMAAVTALGIVGSVAYYLAFSTPAEVEKVKKKKK